MMNTLKWEKDSDAYLYQERNSANRPSKISNEVSDPNIKPSARNQGQAMAGLLNWGDEQPEATMGRPSNISNGRKGNDGSQRRRGGDDGMNDGD
jgi:hypothetical protein